MKKAYGVKNRGRLVIFTLFVKILSSAPSIAEDIETSELNLVELSAQHDEQNRTVEVRAGSSTFRLHYGSSTDGHGIDLTAEQTRYFGVARVHRDGHGVSQVMGIPVKELFVQKLVGVLEYRDLDDDGLFRVDGGNTAGSFEEIYSFHKSTEPVVKWIDYRNINWVLENWTIEDQRDDQHILKFRLIANDLSYVFGNGTSINETVSQIGYQFRLKARTFDSNSTDVPVFDVDYDTINDQITNSKRQQDDRTLSGKVARSTWKYDQLISGWDPLSHDNGTVRDDVRLHVVTTLGHGTRLDAKVGQWMHAQFGGMPSPQAFVGERNDSRDTLTLPLPNQQGHESRDTWGRPLACGLAYVSAEHHPSSGNHPSPKNRAHRMALKDYQNTACAQNGDRIAEGHAHPVAIRAGAMHFADGNHNLGSLRWVSNATTDGYETEVLFQIHGARPVLSSDLRTNDERIYSGLLSVGGYNYAVAVNESIHDPETEFEGMVFDSMGEGVLPWNGVDSKSLFQRPAVLGAAILGLVVVLLAITLRRKELVVPSAPVLSQVSVASSSQGDDWSEYDK